MDKALQTVGHIAGVATAPIRGLVCGVLGVGAFLAAIGAAGTLLLAGILFLLSPHATVGPLLSIAAIALLGAAVLFGLCALLGGDVPLRRR
jgi:hypothetical protein